MFWLVLVRSLNKSETRNVNQVKINFGIFNLKLYHFVIFLFVSPSNVVVVFWQV